MPNVICEENAPTQSSLSGSQEIVKRNARSHKVVPTAIFYDKPIDALLKLQLTTPESFKERVTSKFGIE